MPSFDLDFCVCVRARAPTLSLSPSINAIIFVSSVKWNKSSNNHKMLSHTALILISHRLQCFHPSATKPSNFRKRMFAFDNNRDHLNRTVYFETFFSDFISSTQFFVFYFHFSNSNICFSFLFFQTWFFTDTDNQFLQKRTSKCIFCEISNCE